MKLGICGAVNKGCVCVSAQKSCNDNKSRVSQKKECEVL